VQWEPGFVHIALAGATVILAFLIAAMVRLVFRDWLAERQRRRAWAAIGAAADEGASAPVFEGAEQSSHAYAPVPQHLAVWDIFRTHRHADPMSPTEAVADAGTPAPAVDPLQCVPQDTLLLGAPLVATSRQASEGSDDAAAAPSNGAWERNEVRSDVGKGLRSVAPATGMLGCKLRRQLSPRLATQVCLVANAAWPGSALRVLGGPVNIVSDIVITGQGKKEPPCGKTSQHPPLDGATSGPFTERIAGHAAPARSRLHRDLAKSLDPAAAAEARRQIVALAEVLARQAAREDDAAESAKERSRSPQDMPVEELPSPVAKDDTD
jgi:hypothetical protein